MTNAYQGRNRDFVGYGRTPPHPQWPAGGRVALNFVINIEEGAEPSIDDGKLYSEYHLTEVTTSPLSKGNRDLSAESMFEYGSRVGFWRLFNLFNKTKIPITAFTCAMALKRNPAIAEAISSTDWDICAHGNWWEPHYHMTEVEEQKAILEAVSGIEGSTGKVPKGWYCRYAPSMNTRRLLVEHGGFMYDSDAYNDELPYWVDMEQGPHLVIPYTLNTNDAKFSRGQLSTSGQFFELLSDAFDVLYEEGRYTPKMMTIGLHPRIIGHPNRIKGLIRFLEYIENHEHVWICRRIDIANHWATNFPSSQSTA
jgi:allantoinase